MQTLIKPFNAFKAADAAYQAHLACLRGSRREDPALVARYEDYRELINKKSKCPRLKGLSAQAKGELCAWGEAYKQEGAALNVQTRALRECRAQTWCAAMFALGVQMGRGFLASRGALDERMAQVLVIADSTRKILLDGIGYVNITDDSDYFAKGFYTTIELDRGALFRDLKRCTHLRYHPKPSGDKDMRRLGLVQENNHAHC